MQLPHMSRLGLLAVAFSSGKVLLYSLPHVEDLNAYRRTQVTGRNSCKKMRRRQAGICIVGCCLFRLSHPNRKGRVLLKRPGILLKLNDGKKS